MNARYSTTAVFALCTLCFLSAPGHAAADPPVPFNPGPPDLATNVAANTNLTWNNNTNFTEFILNGGFEAGTFTNWVATNSGGGGWVLSSGTYDPPGPEVPRPPFSGNFSAISQQTGGSSQTLYQDITLPVGANPVTLSWVDRIHNYASQFSADQYFHVEIRRSDNAILQLAFTTNPGDPPTNDWTPRSFDLSSYAGQTIRIAFVEKSSLYYFNLGLDNVSVRALIPLTNTPGVINEVFFGTNPTPGPTDYRGSTTNTSWTLPLLAPQTTYYWQILSRQSNTVTGPVWQFTTAGVDHFAWRAIYSPQTVNQAFNAAVMAQDAFNTTVSNFSGRVALTCFVSGAPGNVQPISPTNSGNFVDGTWSGTIAVEQIVTNVVLRANDGNNHSGTSNPFDVNAANDLSISIAAPPSPAPFGTNLIYTLTVANTGPSEATGVMVTNWLPANIAFISATSSQGTCSQDNGVVTGNLGLIAGGTNATITIVVTSTSIGVTLTNVASVSRAESDAYLGNNTVTAVTQVPLPLIFIADASCVEGNTGTTNMIFRVRLSTPSPQTVQVGYATANGTAIAGSNYVAASGLLTFAPGATSQSIPVAVIGNRTVEPNKTLLVNLSNPTNGTLGRAQAVGIITNDDGIPGEADHFVWHPISSPQMLGQPFSATITGFDYYNHLATNFNGTVLLSSLLTNNLGTNIDFEAGSLAPWVPLNVGAQPGPYQLTSFDVTGTGVVSRAFAILPNHGTPDGIAQNIPLRAGMPYSVDVDIAAYVPDIGNADGGTTCVLIGTNIIAQRSFGEIRNYQTLRSHLHGTYFPPTNGLYPLTLTFSRDYLEAGVWGLADNVYVVGPALFGTIAVVPGVSGNFTNGVWSGSLTVLNRATNAVLVADDGNTHVGYSAGFDVYPSNMPPVILTQPANQTNYVHGSVTFSVVGDGTPPLACQWNLNGTNIVGATNSSLVLTNLRYDQAGSCFASLSNAFGMVTSSKASLTVATHPPVASPDTVTFALGASQLSFNVLSNDSDADGDSLFVQSFTLPSRGILTQGTNRFFLYHPDATFTSGLDQFNYTVADGHGGMATSIVTITVAPRYLTGGDWPTFGNGPAHTGYYPGSLAGAVFAAGWSTNLGVGLNQVAIGNGKVYGTRYNLVTALDAISGQLAWQCNFQSGCTIFVNPPTFNNGSVYAQHVNNSADTQLWCFNSSDGSTNWIAPHGAQWEQYYAPTVAGDGVWVGGGYYGGMCGFNTNGTFRFFFELPQYDHWSPSWYQGTVYRWVAGGFGAHDPLTGALLWSLSFPWPPGTIDTIPAIDAGLAFVETVTNLMAIDLTTHSNIWSVSAYMKGSPAVARGTVYAITGDSVKAFSAQDGSGLGVYQATNDTGITWQPIVTDDALFVASGANTYIFGLASHQLTQTIPFGGQLSIANGWLYIASLDGWLRAYYPVNYAALDHFVWSPISSPQFVNTPFSVTIQARNASNSIVTDFTGSVTLSAAAGIPMNPIASDNFTAGIWSGTVEISQPSTNLMLQAGVASGHFGVANPIRVVNLPALTITCSATNLQICWPVNPSGFVLETSPDMSPGTWAPVTGSPVEVGGQFSQPITVSNARAFYRLRFAAR